jgi:tetratricopeptide (TPR) repeat protein
MRIDLYADQLERLRAGGEVVSVTGPPGAGKTTWVRMSLPDALHVDVASARDPEDVLTRVWLALDDQDTTRTLEETMRARGETTLVLDHADAALGAGAGALLDTWLEEVPGWRFVLVGREAHAPWERRLITLSRPDRGALDALARRWLPDASAHWRGRLIDLCETNPGALFVLSKRARLMPLDELVTGFDPGLLGAFGATLSGTSDALGAASVAVLEALSLFRGPFTLEEARQVCGAAFDIDAFQTLADAGWLVRSGRSQWEVPKVLRTRGEPSADLRTRHARALDTWARRWDEARDAPELIARLDDLLDAWRWVRSAPEVGACASLFDVLAWLTTAPATSTWTGKVAREQLARADELDRRIKELARQGRWSEAIGELHQSLVVPGIERDSERVTLWANLAKLYKRQGELPQSAAASREAFEAATGMRDWARAARHAWRAHQAWAKASEPELAAQMAHELAWLCEEQPSARAAVPEEALVALEAPPQGTNDTEEYLGTLRVTPSRDGFHDADGAFVDLKRKRVAARVLSALVDAHARGEALSARELFERGWPGQHAIGEESAMNRLRVAVARLRGLGLGTYLVTTAEGYLLPPDLEVVTVARG